MRSNRLTAIDTCLTLRDLGLQATRFITNGVFSRDELRETADAFGVEIATSATGATCIMEWDEVMQAVSARGMDIVAMAERYGSSITALILGCTTKTVRNRVGGHLPTASAGLINLMIDHRVVVIAAANTRYMLTFADRQELNEWHKGNREVWDQYWKRKNWPRRW